LSFDVRNDFGINAIGRSHRLKYLKIAKGFGGNDDRIVRNAAARTQNKSNFHIKICQPRVKDYFAK
jgi:ribosomal protein L20